MYICIYITVGICMYKLHYVSFHLIFINFRIYILQKKNIFVIVLSLAEKYNFVMNLLWVCL